MLNEFKPLRVLIACEHASAFFGGEAALPLHYFRVLHARGEAVWLVTHARTRPELNELYGDTGRIHYIEDTAVHRALWRIGGRLPARLAYITTGFASRLLTQLEQRRIVRRLVREHGIDVVHQPMPVSPREPSMMFSVGAPVVIGPMNGAMDYPPAFARYQSALVSSFISAGRWASHFFNWLIPGKRRSAALLVANQRTGLALPPAPNSLKIELIENGVNLNLWQGQDAARDEAVAAGRVPTFLFMGRLVDWKAVDLLLLAFQRACTQSGMSLTLAGEGPERSKLEKQCERAGLLAQREGEVGKVFFAGWQTQAQCAELLQHSSALVLPSLMECGGAVVLEAMAACRPVIATNWGGPADYLDESCGILVPPDSREGFIEGLAKALVDLSQSHALRLKLGRAGYDKVRRLFDWEVKVDRMMDIYRQAVRGCASSPR